MIKTISTTPYNDQKMGTAGLRKKSRVAIQPNYVENFMQSIFNTIGKLDDKTFLVGGDGRFYNDVAIQKIIKMAAANGVKKLVIGQNGFISTPAGSHVILTAVLFSLRHTTPAARTATSASNIPTKPADRFPAR